MEAWQNLVAQQPQYRSNEVLIRAEIFAVHDIDSEAKDGDKW